MYHFWAVRYLAFPQTSDWTCVAPHEALVALSIWSSFHLMEENIQPCIFYIISMYTPLSYKE